MNCPIRDEETAEILLAYIARRLDPGKTALLEQHMDACPACAEFRANQQMVWRSLDQWEAPPVTADFNRRLYQRIEAEAAEPWYRRLFHAPSEVWKPAIPLVAACLLVVAGFVFDHRVSPSPGAKAPVQSVSASEAEQVESTLDDLQLLRQLDNGTAGTPSEPM